MKNINSRIFAVYKKFFSVEEIENDRILKWAFGAFLLGLFLTFNKWIGNSEFTVDSVARGASLCWPYFQNCSDLAFLSALPFGYTQTMFFMGVWAVMALIIYCMSLGKWGEAHFLTLLLWVFKALMTFISFSHIGNYEYYVVIFGLALLVLPQKLFFLRFYLVLFYFLSVAVKIHETWILGTYFSAMHTGLPIFPDWSIPVWTNLVMFMEVVAAWFLFHKNTYIQRIVFLFFVAFHLYSGVLVEYRYPTTVLPMLLILFGPWFEYKKIPKGWSTLPGWIVVCVMCLGQSWSHFIPGDEKFTLEGNYFGLYMFEANHQCVSKAKIYYTDGEVREKVKQRRLARHRCDPYKYWYQQRERCRVNNTIDRIEWTFDHSINGGPFYRLIDESNACNLEYSAWKHNEWIKFPDEAKIIGYPVKNYYH